MRRLWRERVRRALRAFGWLAAALWLTALASGAHAAGLEDLLRAARPAAGNRCDPPVDALARVLCTGVLRVGVRTSYPPFASRTGDTPQGFEIDLARRLAAELGATPEFTVVTPANRIALLGEGRVDVVIATMGHTVQRDREALFVRPHYYESRTAVIGRRELVVWGLDDLRGKTVCVTVGNSTNAELSAHGARLMLFDSAPRLVDELRLGGCSLVAQDDTFFALHLQQPAFAADYELKFGFGRLPWGAAVARRDGARLAEALGQVLRQLHADGSLEALAAVHGVDPRFLREQQGVWSEPPCAGAPLSEAGCLQPPRDSQLEPTAFAPAIERMEQAVQRTTGIKLTLAMFKSQVGLGLFFNGILFSLALVAGAVAATFGMALVFGAALGSRHGWLRWPMRCLLWVMQSTPMILLMILAGVLVTAFGPASPLSALAGAIAVLGLFNGSNAGQAVAEAMTALRVEHPGAPVSLSAAVHRSSAQLLAFVVNATRGSPAASIIGVPELLSALTDIASFSSERVTTYTLLLLFYMGVVALVVRLGHAWQARLARHEVGRA